MGVDVGRGWLPHRGREDRRGRRVHARRDDRAPLRSRGAHPSLPLQRSQVRPVQSQRQEQTQRRRVRRLHAPRVTDPHPPQGQQDHPEPPQGRYLHGHRAERADQDRGMGTHARRLQGDVQSRACPPPAASRRRRNIPLFLYLGDDARPTPAPDPHGPPPPPPERSSTSTARSPCGPS